MATPGNFTACCPMSPCGARRPAPRVARCLSTLRYCRSSWAGRGQGNGRLPAGGTAHAPRRLRDGASQLITKGFGRLRHRLGIDEREQGARQANVDLHSLRLWFVAKARDAINLGVPGFKMYTVAEVVGHVKGELGLSMTSR